MVAFKPITFSAAFLAVSSAALAAPYEKPTSTEFAAELAKRGGEGYDGEDSNQWGGPASIGFWVPGVLSKWGWGNGANNGGYSDHGSNHGDNESHHDDNHSDHYSEYSDYSDRRSEWDEDVDAEENWDENENENLNNNANNNVNNNVNNNQNDNVNINKIIDDLMNRNAVFDSIDNESSQPSYGTFKCVQKRDGSLTLSKRSFEELMSSPLAKRSLVKRGSTGSGTAPSPTPNTGYESGSGSQDTPQYESDTDYYSSGYGSSGYGSSGYGSSGYGSSGRRGRYQRRPQRAYDSAHRAQLINDVVNQNTNTNRNDLSSSLQNQDQATVTAQNALSGFEDEDFYGRYSAGEDSSEAETESQEYASGNSYQKRSPGSGSSSNSASTAGKRTCYSTNNAVSSGCGTTEPMDVCNANQNTNENALNAQYQAATTITVNGADQGEQSSQYVKRGGGGRRGNRFDEYMDRYMSRFDERLTNNMDYNELYNNNANNNENNNVENNKNENILVTKVQSEQTDINSIEEQQEQDYVDCYFSKGQGQSQGQFYRK